MYLPQDAMRDFAREYRAVEHAQIEMPRFFSNSIQSEVACAWPRRALTEPASRMAPP